MSFSQRFKQPNFCLIGFFFALCSHTPIVMSLSYEYSLFFSLSVLLHFLSFKRSVLGESIIHIHMGLYGVAIATSQETIGKTW